jgi:flagellar basal-body rod modification protein FlgD
MTSIEATTGTATTATQPKAPTDSSTSALSSDFDTFLKMLTAQMQNQDPLNPIESADFAVQLATFSNVEQQVQTNDLLSRLIDQSGMQTMARMSEWIGKQVRVATTGGFDGSPITVAPAPAQTASTADLTIRNAAGQIVNRFAIPVSSDPVEWTGTTASGTQAPWGTYNFEVNSYGSDGSLLTTTTPEIYAEVTEARKVATGVELVLKSGASVDSDLVSGVRSAK